MFRDVGLEGVEHLGQGSFAVHEAGGEVDAVTDGARLARIDELLEAVEVHLLAAEAQGVEAGCVDLHLAPSTRGVEARGLGDAGRSANQRPRHLRSPRARM